MPNSDITIGVSEGCYPLNYYFARDQEGLIRLRDLPAGTIAPGETYYYEGPSPPNVSLIIEDPQTDRLISITDSSDILYTFSNCSNLLRGTQTPTRRIVGKRGVAIDLSNGREVLREREGVLRGSVPPSQPKDNNSNTWFWILVVLGILFLVMWKR